MTALLPRPGLDGVAAVEMSADTISPVTAALRLRDSLAFILESVEGGARYGRYSMVGVRGRILTARGAARARFFFRTSPNRSIRAAQGATVDDEGRIDHTCRRAGPPPSSPDSHTAETVADREPR